MAKSRRKAGGGTRGLFRVKRMGKGWSTHRRQPTPHRPAATIDDLAGIEAGSAAAAEPPAGAAKPAVKVAVGKKVTKQDTAAVLQPAGGRTGAKKAPAKKAPATEGTAAKAAPKKAPARKAATKKTTKKTAKKATAKKAPAKKSGAKKSDEAKGQDSD
jgi:hypothetical protein